MTDISITSANVVPTGNYATETGTAGATITAGQVVYLDTSVNKYKLADADDAAAAVRTPRGIALNSASSGQPLTIIKSGDVTIGGTLTKGVAYYLSPTTAGGIAPVADVASGDDVVLLGIAKSASVLAVSIIAPGVAL